MNLKLVAGLVGLQLLLRASGSLNLGSFLALSILSSVILLESQRDFDAIAAELSSAGKKASAPCIITGKSGVKHEFSFGLLDDSGPPRVVVDTELSVKEVDEMKVLKFYVKVFDVSPGDAVLCVSPKLSDRAGSLAKEYGITVLENEVPRNLIPMARKVIMGMS